MWEARSSRIFFLFSKKKIPKTTTTKKKNPKRPSYLEKNSPNKTFVLIACYLNKLIRKAIHLSKILLHSHVETDISTLSTAGINFNSKLASQSKFVYIPQQPGAHCGFLRKGRKVWRRRLGSFLLCEFGYSVWFVFYSIFV